MANLVVLIYAIYGHISLLQRAKDFGDMLLVGLNSDESIKKNLKEKTDQLIIKKIEKNLFYQLKELMQFIVMKIQEIF